MTCACIVHAVLDSWLPYGIGYGIRDTEYVVPYLRQGMASAVSACSLTNAKALGDHRTCVLRLLRAHEAVPGALGGAVCGRRKPPSPALLSQCFRSAFALNSGVRSPVPLCQWQPANGREACASISKALHHSTVQLSSLGGMTNVARRRSIHLSHPHNSNPISSLLRTTYVHDHDQSPTRPSVNQAMNASISPPSRLHHRPSSGWPMAPSRRRDSCLGSALCSPSRLHSVPSPSDLCPLT